MGPRGPYHMQEKKTVRIPKISILAGRDDQCSPFTILWSFFNRDWKWENGENNMVNIFLCSLIHKEKDISSTITQWTNPQNSRWNI